RIQEAWSCFRKYNQVLYERTSSVSSKLKIRVRKAKVPEVLLHGCMMWTLCQAQYLKICSHHHKFLHCCIGFRNQPGTHYTLLKTRFESIKAMVCKCRLPFAGSVAHTEDEQLPKILMFEEIVNGKRKEGRWTCLQDDLDKFRIEVEGWSAKATDEQ
ncbi:unnamed protein product, partial [Choristocarpus tenellus]